MALSAGILYSNACPLLKEKKITLTQEDTLHFHAPCFDGLISAVVASDYLETAQDWNIQKYLPMTYNLDEAWLQERLPQRSAIVDFLYHPDATFWVDHHMTTFLDENKDNTSGAARKNYELALKSDLNRTLIYDKTAKSGAGLLWKHVQNFVSDKQRYAEMIAWAEKTDSASYDTPEQAVYGEDYALRIAHGLGTRIPGNEEFLKTILQELRHKTLQEVAALPLIYDRFIERRTKIEEGMEILRKNARVTDDGIGFYEVTLNANQEIPRFGLFLEKPEIRYSLTLIHGPNSSKISASRNPWGEMNIASLGDIFRNHGGGGHHSVGSTIIPKEIGIEKAKESFKQIFLDITSAEKTKKSENSRGR